MLEHRIHFSHLSARVTTCRVQGFKGGKGALSLRNLENLHHPQTVCKYVAPKRDEGLSRRTGGVLSDTMGFVVVWFKAC